MKTKIKNGIIGMIIIVSLLLTNTSFVSADTDTADSKIKNIIFMIPDG